MVVSDARCICVRRHFCELTRSGEPSQSLGKSGYESDRANAMMHAVWFALNRASASSLEVSESDVRALGIAHESDWRDSWLDSARDLLNNEVGIEIGRSAPMDKVSTEVEKAFKEGRLFCLTDDFKGIVSCGAGVVESAWLQGVYVVRVTQRSDVARSRVCGVARPSRRSRRGLRRGTRL